ncbi:MAG TPA: hypothetical protein P5017_03975 [Anaerohalosphaeraceae bacterium]|nr:hypothetical protein [Anaerohalosphaeraceae bacterium]
MKIGKQKVYRWLLSTGPLLLVSGCTMLGFLGSPTSSEQKVSPQFPLYNQKDRSIYLAVRPTAGSRTDADIPDLLQKTLAADLHRKVKIPTEAIFLMPPASANPSASFSWTQLEEEARRKGAAFLLYVEITDCELIRLTEHDYYMGNLAVRTILLKTDTAEVAWPPEKTPRLIRTSVDFESRGRSAVLQRLLTAVSHCIVRNLYPCPQTDFRISEEMETMDTLFNQAQ